MTEQNDNFEVKAMVGIPESVTYTADGAAIEVGTYGSADLGVEERRAILADAYGVEPEQVISTTEARGRRLSVGFRRWNSSWDPHAEKPADPSLN